MSPRQTLSLEDTLLQLLFRSIVNTLYGTYLPRSYVCSDGLLRQRLIWLFSVVPELHGFLVCCPRISLNDFQMVPVAPIITGITVVCTVHYYYYYLLISNMCYPIRYL
jgi:hypothetical protein